MNGNIREKVIEGHKNGMVALILITLGYIVSFFLLLFPPITIIGVIYICVGWFLYVGLKVLKPGEALVLTLFGKYVGTLNTCPSHSCIP